MITQSNKMGLYNLVWFLLFSSVLMFEQDKYIIIFERMEVVSFDPSYLVFAKTHNFKFNRTHSATNYSLDAKVAVESDVMVEIQAYKMASNEYREFPLRFMFNYCEFVRRKEFGLEKLFACGNSTGCPFKKGLYRSCVWSPNSEKFPPLVPAGKYMLDMKFFHGTVEYVFLQGFGTVKYPECKTCFF